MKLLMVSDLHCEKEPKAFDWLQDVIQRHRPDFILGAGDWGECENYPQVYPKERLITIYGNHDNVREIEEKYTLLDGTIIEIGDVKTTLRIAGISGIISPKGTPTPTGVPRKTPAAFLEKARDIGASSIDILILHEAPYMPEVFGRMWRSVGSLTALQALKEVKPKILFVGHLHLVPALHAELDDGMRVIHVDSSQGGYIVWDLEKGTLTGYANGLRVFETALTLEEFSPPPTAIGGQ